MAAFQGARRAMEDLLSQPRHVLVLRITLLLLLLHAATTWTLSIPLTILCGIMLICAPLLTSPLLWLVVFAAAVWTNAMDWYSIDNHKYLITYWCLACALAVAARDPDRVLSSNGRWLVGLCFLFATSWKLLSGQYLDGSFLHSTFLLDSRLETPAVLLSGLGTDVIAQNRDVGRSLAFFAGKGVGVDLQTSDSLRLWTLACSWWTLSIEGVVAAAFLLRRPAWLHRARHLLLMAFIGTTYLLLPVIGFSFSLALLGLAQCPVHMRRTRIAYLLVLVFVQLTRIPWDDYVMDLVR